VPNDDKATGTTHHATPRSITTDKRSEITNDPNNPDDERYIVKLILKIVTVSVETVKLMQEIGESELI
jgi:predicted helicase